MEFLQAYTFHIKHKGREQSKVVGALSRRYSLLLIMPVHLLGFEVFKELYEDDLYFGKVCKECSIGPYNN